MREPKEKLRRDLEITGVFDIETEDWTKYVVGALYLGGDLFRIHDWREEEKLVDRILDVEGTLWAHNGGKYDTLWLLGHIARRGIKVKVFVAGDRIVSMETEKGKLKIRDSYALVPLALGKAGAIANVYKSETNLACICGMACKGYCAIRRGMPARDLAQVTDYLKQDCRATMALLEKIREYGSLNDLDLSSTIGASAWACASRWGGIKNAEWKKKTDYEFARAGYYGGRVQVFQPFAPRGYRYDINSSYPAALAKTALPTGNRSFVFFSHARAAYRDEQPGIYECEVHVPSCHVPPLPYRTRDRIGYPIGSFRGVWTLPELRYAESQGIQLTRIVKAVVWDETAPVLSNFAKRIWDLRHAAGKSTALGKWLKLYANSLTGKLAQRPEKESVVVCPDPEDIQFCPANFPCMGVLCGSKCCIHKCTGACGRWRALGAEELVWTHETWRIPSSGHVQWAAYLTAVARIELHKQLVSDFEQGHSAVYCDTDSVYSTTPREYNLGEDLGQWLPEGEFREFEAMSPKVYRYIDAKTGEPNIRAKGIPGADKKWEDIHAGRDIAITDGVQTFKTAVRNGEFFAKKNAHRHINPSAGYYGDRLRMGNRTVALSASEVEAL